MRRALDRAAVDSMVLPSARSQSPSLGRKRKTVSFQEDALGSVAFELREEIVEPETPPRRNRDLPRTGEDRSASRSQRSEDQARRNLSRLVRNHQRLAESCDCQAWTALCDCRSSVGSLFEASSRHAVIAGDMMFIGCQPGVAGDSLMLAGAEVSVGDTTVAISTEGMPIVLQSLASEDEAERWAAKVREAAGLWQQCEQLTKTALHAQRQWHEVNREADTGGTETACMGSGVASCSARGRPSSPPKGAMEKPVKSALKDSGHGSFDQRTSRPWVQVTSRTCGAGDHAPLLDADSTSNWRWMLSLFHGPAVMVA